MKLRIPRRTHIHIWKIVSVGSDMRKFFGDELEPVPSAAAGDLAIGRGCLMRICEKCGKREILRDIEFEPGPAAGKEP
jgi:hypothetical protein